MKFIIITPSLNQLENLKCAVASVADQVSENIQIHHHIQDAKSSDGTAEWLSNFKSQNSNYKLTFCSEPDSGMYNALNKGFNFALNQNNENAILAWLNCDEQYLPNTLQKVAVFFQKHKKIDLLWGNFLLTDENRGLIAFRKSYPARYSYIATSHLYNFSCALFFRQRVWQKTDGFDEKWRAVADEDFILRALKFSCKTACINEFLSAFTFDGKNLSETPLAKQEQREIKNQVPEKIKNLSKILNLLRLTEKLINGAYFQKFPIEYSLYTHKSGEQRKTFTAKSATQKWPV